MRTIVATATTEQEATSIWLVIAAEQPHIEFASINGLQVTVIYTPVAEVEAQREQANQEWMQQHAPKKVVKKRKQPKALKLQEKANNSGLSRLVIDKSNGIYTITSIGSSYGNELLFTSKSGVAVSKKLTQLAWSQAVANNPRVDV
jgi:hypothetical protein